MLYLPLYLPLITPSPSLPHFGMKHSALHTSGATQMHTNQLPVSSLKDYLQINLEATDFLDREQ